MVHVIAPPLERLREHALACIDAALAPSPLQGLYAVKLAEARRVLAGEASPILQAEADATGVSLDVLARTIVAQAEAAAQREARRIAAKAQVRAAADHAAVLAALAAAQVTLS